MFFISLKQLLFKKLNINLLRDKTVSFLYLQFYTPLHTYDIFKFFSHSTHNKL